MSTEKLIFVYGTLKRACSNHHYLGDQEFVGAARTAPGFCLYALDGFPGMVAKPDDRDGVVGEIWSVDAAAFGITRLFGDARCRLAAPRRDRSRAGPTATSSPAKR
jgi:gamma-glutamylcyclotransferase (GGCT)/AIG2-like uncharacterized protein YtfP